MASLMWSFAGSAAAPAVLAAARQTLAVFAQNAMKRIAAIIARSGLKTLAKPLSREIIVPLGERIAPAAQRIAALNERIAASGPLIRYPAAIVKGGIGAGLMGAGLDAGTQGLQILEGHRDDGFDLKQTFQTSLQWGAGGAAGGPAHELMGNLLKSRVSPFTTKFVSGTVGGAVGAVGMYGAGLGTQLYDNDGNWNKVDKTFHPQLLIGGLAMGAMGGANHGLSKEHGPTAPTTHDTSTSSDTHPASAAPKVPVAVEQPNHLQPQDLHLNSGGEQPTHPLSNENGQQVTTARANAPVVDSGARPGAVSAPETRTPTGDHTRPLDGSTKFSDSKLPENATRPTLSNDRAGDATAPRDTAPSRPTTDSPARASTTQTDLKANVAAGKQDLAAPVSANRSADVRPVAGMPATESPLSRAEPVQRPTDAIPDAPTDHAPTRTNDIAPEQDLADPGNPSPHKESPKLDTDAPAPEQSTRDRTTGLTTDETPSGGNPSDSRPIHDPTLAPLPHAERPAPTTNRASEPTARAAAANAGERPAALPRESNSHSPEPEAAHPAEAPPAEGDWSPRPIDDWSRMSPKEVSDELARRWDVETAGFDNPNLHPEAVREFARAVDDMLSRYPDVKLPKVSIEPLELDYYAGAIPHYSTDGLVTTDVLVLNEHYAVDPEKMARELASDEADGHLVPGSSDRPIHSTLVHEFAHAIFFEGQERASDTALEALDNYYETTRGGMNEAAVEKWLDQLSGYSFDEEGRFNADEALAEAFTDVEYNGEAATEPAKVLYWHLLDNASQHSIAPNGFTHIPEHTIARPGGARPSDSFAPKTGEPEHLPANEGHPESSGTEPDKATPQPEQHPSTAKPELTESHQPAAEPNDSAPVHKPDESHQPNTASPRTKVTQVLRDNIDELRNRAREVLNAHDGLARVDELPNLRRQYIEQLDVLGLREPESAAAAWQAFNEYDPALAKYLVDYAHDLLPPTETAPAHSQPHTPSAPDEPNRYGRRSEDERVPRSRPVTDLDQPHSERPPEPDRAARLRDTQDTHPTQADEHKNEPTPSEGEQHPTPIEEQADTELLDATQHEADQCVSWSPSKNRPAVAEGLRLASGEVFTAPSLRGESTTLHPEVQRILDAIPVTERGRGHGSCGLPRCISEALDAGLDPTGAKAAAKIVRSNTDHPKHGHPVGPCESCKPLREHYLLDFITDDGK
ncbi:hypothetical protein GFY24_38225 [Nocardia sp. SYP-A9097]|uniref:YwqJ-related putative deaminase n=1 Tax=Nocardia sp. SYP-A9097 TaxID=2663237 RepID=UPI00129BF0B3|nr:YwqJ-related putative deaminase [Nocardia sp. SYP-A9097]MRH93191.1 hypothetical protein [Nocardia sp. SYP-A9097]